MLYTYFDTKLNFIKNKYLFEMKISLIDVEFSKNEVDKK